jgi:hypothetical protein
MERAIWNLETYMENNIKICLQEVGSEDMNLVEVA